MPSTHDLNVDVRCPRINGVLHKLLDNGGDGGDDLGALQEVDGVCLQLPYLLVFCGGFGVLHFVFFLYLNST